MATPVLLELSDSDRDTLEAWCVQFDAAWHDDALAVWAADRLPPSATPLRRAALSEIIKIDLERQWQQGRQRTLGSYLERFPELGTLETVSADLVFAEYQVRQQFGVAVDLSDYARRFPAQAAELARLAQEAADRSRTPSAAELDTSRPGLATETTAPEAARGKDLPETFGRYHILKKLGQGGMGAVYLAHDSQLNRQVALKVPTFVGSDRKDLLDRFLREAQAMATIRHPNLCPVYDVGEIDGVHFMTMAYIEGHLLADHIRSDQPASEQQAATVICQLALALQEAHAHGIVHRDLKPTNIFIDQRDEPIVLDFGLARRTTDRDAALTQAGTLLGTAAYMAPEQARGKAEAMGPPCDIYSLGVILYELLTGQRPFRGELLEVLSLVLTAEPEPPSKHRPDLDRRLEAICLKAIAKRPEDRHASMADFAAALTDFLKVRQAFQPDPNRPAPSASSQAEEPGVPEPEEPYGLTQAVAGLSQLLAGHAPAPAPESSVEPAPSDPPRARRVSLDPAATADRQVSRPVPRASSQAGKPDVPEADQSYVIPAPSEATDAPSASPRRGVRRPWLWTTAALAAASAALFFAVVFYVATNHGTVKIELSDPQAQVQLQVDGDTISITGLDRPLRLRAGEHNLIITGDDFEAVTQSFTVKRGTEEPLRVTLVPRNSTPVQIAESAVTPKPATPSAESPETAVTSPNPLPTITNSIGMKLVLIPAGEFLMGSKVLDRDAGDDELPQHSVRITQPLYLGVHEVTLGQFRQFVEEAQYTAGAEDWRDQFRDKADDFPVAFVSWEDATAFCKWLSGKEGRTYRLPTEAEWEYACRAGTQTRFTFGDDEKDLSEYAWFGDNSGFATHPVGQKKPNAWGLYDMHGNVYEWCQDWYSEGSYRVSPPTDPTGPDSASSRVYRGGVSVIVAAGCRSARRGGASPVVRSYDLGFRLAADPTNAAASSPATVPPPTVTPAPATRPAEPEPKPAPAVATTGPLPTITNSVGMKLALIPAGEFLMGSKVLDQDAGDDELPQHSVRITQPFYLGIHEVTLGQFRRFVEEAQYTAGAEEWRGQFRDKADDLPVVYVSWEDATAFCKWLSGKENRTYRLPTEAEWEYACRAGTQTRFGFGDEEENLSEYAWFSDNSGRTTHPVGQKKPNAWGLYDMHGNVFEWCQDWYSVGYYKVSPQTNPTGPESAAERVLRGAGCISNGADCRSAYRLWNDPAVRPRPTGFRLATDRTDSVASPPATAPSPPVAPVPAAKPVEPEPKPAVPATDALPTITNSIGMKLVLIPAGEFLMGSQLLDRDAKADELPQHSARITQPFYLGIYEVTLGQFRRFVEEAQYTAGAEDWQNQFRDKADDLPVAHVSWEDATAFCKWLSGKENRTYRLPTEAEWEYACRAGTQTRFSFGDDEKALSDYAWFDDDSGYVTHPVGQKKPNAWGLHDMHGNVCEWCQDWYSEGYYKLSPPADPPGPDSASCRMHRGGGLSFSAALCRSAFRGRGSPEYRDDDLGFRVAVVQSPR